jgi:hypothetical protein
MGSDFYMVYVNQAKRFVRFGCLEEHIYKIELNSIKAIQSNSLQFCPSGRVLDTKKPAEMCNLWRGVAAVVEIRMAQLSPAGLSITT